MIVAQAHTGGSFVADNNFIHIGISGNINALALHKSLQFLDQLASASHTEKYTPASFKVMNQGVDSGGFKGVAPHQIVGEWKKPDVSAGALDGC